MWFIRCSEICYNEEFLAPNKLLENIIRLDITMHNFLRVNMIKRDAYHRENFENILFWQKLVGIALDYIRETLVALFHNDAWMVIFIFDNINDGDNHWMFENS